MPFAFKAVLFRYSVPKGLFHKRLRAFQLALKRLFHKRFRAFHFALKLLFHKRLRAFLLALRAIYRIVFRIFMRISVKISSEAILRKLLPQARPSSAFWLGFVFRIFVPRSKLTAPCSRLPAQQSVICKNCNEKRTRTRERKLKIATSAQCKINKSRVSR